MDDELEVTQPQDSLSPAQIRQKLQDAVIADLLGPANGPEEIVDEVSALDRYTFHEEARSEVITRLLALNHERYAEEIVDGLHDKKKGKAKSAGKKGERKKPAPDNQMDLL